MKSEDYVICSNVDKCTETKFIDNKGNVINCEHSMPHTWVADCNAQYCMRFHYGGCICEQYIAKTKILKFDDKDFEV